MDAASAAEEEEEEEDDDDIPLVLEPVTRNQQTFSNSKLCSCVCNKAICCTHSNNLSFRVDISGCTLVSLWSRQETNLCCSANHRRKVDINTLRRFMMTSNSRNKLVN